MKKLKKGLLAEFPQASRNRAAHLRGSRKSARSLRQGFGGSQNLPATVRLISGSPGNQRGACGKLSGGRKTFPQPCGSFPGVPETSAELAARFRGVAKPSAECAAHFDYFFTIQRFYQLTIYRLSEEIATFTHRLFFFVW